MRFRLLLAFAIVLAPGASTAQISDEFNCGANCPRFFDFRWPDRDDMLLDGFRFKMVEEWRDDFDAPNGVADDTRGLTLMQLREPQSDLFGEWGDGERYRVRYAFQEPPAGSILLETPRDTCRGECKRAISNPGPTYVFVLRSFSLVWDGGARDLRRVAIFENDGWLHVAMENDDRELRFDMGRGFPFFHRIPREFDFQVEWAWVPRNRTFDSGTVSTHNVLESNVRDGASVISGFDLSVDDSDGEVHEIRLETPSDGRVQARLVTNGSPEFRSRVDWVVLGRRPALERPDPVRDADFSDRENVRDCLYSVVALIGEPAPGAGGGTLRFDVNAMPLDAARINGSGEVAFRAVIEGGSADAGVFREAAGAIRRVALAGEPAPGTDGGAFDSFAKPSIDAAGNVYFRAVISGGSVSTGIFRVDPAGVATVVVLPGQAAPDTGGGTYASVGSPRVNAQGDMIFSASIAGGSADRAIMTVHADGTHVITLLDGLDSPLGGSYALSGGARAAISNDREAAMHAMVSGGAASEGIFRSFPPGVASALIAQGDVLPGTNGGTLTFLQTGPFFGPLHINTSSQVLFGGMWQGGASRPFQEGLFLANPLGPAEAVVRLGDLAPGTGGGVHGLLLGSALNDRGEVVFASSVGASRFALTLRDAQGAHSVFALTGSSAPGGTYGVFLNPEMNDSGDAVFFATVETGPGEGTGGLYRATCPRP